MTDKVKKESLDISLKHKKELKKLFPEIFTENKVKNEAGTEKIEEKIDFSRLRMLLGEKISNNDERYSFNWAGKQDAINNIQTSSKGTLVPEKDESVDFNNSNNLFIEGENLEVLKLLQKSYSNSVKMIYIDPPYNTGGDFVYKDNYTEGIENYLRKTGQIDEEGNKLTTNPESNGRFHSDWLSMMYPRLYLAKNILRNDGVIFVSIDDNEFFNLRKIMNNIFGEENFIATFVWKRRSGANDSKNFVSKDHEYIVAYSSKDFDSFNGILKDFSNYTNPDNDPRGPWMKDNLTCGKTAEERPNLYYPLTDPKTGIIYECNPDRVWAYEPEKMERLIDEGKVIFPDNEDGRPMYKRHQAEVRSDRKPVSTWIEPSTTGENDLASEQFIKEVSIMQTPLNSYGTKEIRRLFEESIINYPKPSILIKELIEQTTDKDDIILDFFAGSATTAHSVLEINKENGGNRKFIMIQFPELYEEPITLKDGRELKTIADGARERIRRVINGYVDNEPIDDGFKVFKLAKSNYKIWEELNSKKTTANDLKEQMELFQDSLIEGYNDVDVIYEVIIKEGYSLNSDIDKIKLDNNNYTVYKVIDNNQYFYITLDENINENIVNELNFDKETLFICLDNSLTDETKINLSSKINLKTI